MPGPVQIEIPGLLKLPKQPRAVDDLVGKRVAKTEAVDLRLELLFIPSACLMQTFDDGTVAVFLPRMAPEGRCELALYTMTRASEFYHAGIITEDERDRWEAHEREMRERDELARLKAKYEPEGAAR